MINIPKRVPQPSVKRLIIEQGNGKVRYLEGEAAQRCMEQIDNVLGFMQITRSYLLPKGFLQFPWREIDVSKAPKLFQQRSEPAQGK